MSIGESVAAWLKSYDGGFELTDQISTDRLEATPEAYGIFKAPGDETRRFVDGSRDATVHYLFIARQPAQTDRMRIGNHKWLEGLERWIREQTMRRALPDLGAGRTCFAITVADSYAAEEQSDAEITYQISVAVEYFEEART